MQTGKIRWEESMNVGFSVGGGGGGWQKNKVESINCDRLKSQNILARE